MPVEIPDISVTRTVTTQEKLKPVGAWINRFASDASNKVTAPAEMEFAPFALADDKQTRIFADDASNIRIKTSDLFEVAKRIPSVAAWLQAGLTAGADLIADTLASVDALDAANAALAAALDAEAAALASRNDAFQQRAGVDDPLWVKTNAAWQTALATTRTAQGNVEIAKAAVADPAKPRLVIA